MSESSEKVVQFPSESSRDVLTELLREGAREMLAGSVKKEVAAYVEERAHLTDELGRQLVGQYQEVAATPAPRQNIHNGALPHS